MLKAIRHNKITTMTATDIAIFVEKAIPTIAKLLVLGVLLLAAFILRLVFKKRWQRMSPYDKEVRVTFATGFAITISIGLFIPGVFQHVNQATLIGIASIVVVSYLPFAIALLQDAGEELHWDKQVVVGTVLGLLQMTMLLTVGLIIPIFFWQASSDALVVQDIPAIKTVLLGLFAAGISGYIWSILKIYSWISGLGQENSVIYRRKKRREFLLLLPDTRKTGIWNAKTWQQISKLSLIEQEELIEIFAKHMEEMPNQEDASIIIDDSVRHLQLLALHRPKIYGCFFHLAFQSSPGDDRDANWLFDNSVRELQMKLIENSVINSPTHPHYLSSLFFIQCKEIMADLEKKSPSSSLLFMEKIAKSLFEVWSNQDYDNIAWRGFPSEWQITANNLRKKGGKSYAQIWLRTYRIWAINTGLQRLSRSLKEDSSAMQITMKLLPGVHPGLWINLLYLVGLNFRAKTEEDIKGEIETFVSMWEAPLYVWSPEALVLEDDDSDDAKFQSQQEEIVAETIAIFQYTEILAQSTNKGTIKKYIAAARELIKNTTVKSRRKALGVFIDTLDNLNNANL